MPFYTMIPPTMDGEDSRTAPFSGTTLNKHGPNLVDYDYLTRVDD